MVQFWFKNDINNISDNAHYKFGSTEVMPDTDGAVVVQITLFHTCSICLEHFSQDVKSLSNILNN